MSNLEFYNRHKNNGGDLATWDGTLSETHTEPRQANKSLKRHNYIFERALSDLAKDIEVVQPITIKP
jgi:hypothetical protein